MPLAIIQLLARSWHQPAVFVTVNLLRSFHLEATLESRCVQPVRMIGKMYTTRARDPEFSHNRSLCQLHVPPQRSRRDVPFCRHSRKVSWNTTLSQQAILVRVQPLYPLTWDILYTSGSSHGQGSLRGFPSLHPVSRSSFFSLSFR